MLQKCESLCNAKATHIFQQEISMYLPYFKIEILTSRLLTTSLSFKQLASGKFLNPEPLPRLDNNNVTVFIMHSLHKNIFLLTVDQFWTSMIHDCVLVEKSD